jgi:hypothetical protein
MESRRSSKQSNFEVGDKVRVKLHKSAKYTDEVFEIKEVNSSYSYSLVDKDNKAIDGQFYSEEMISDMLVPVVTTVGNGYQNLNPPRNKPRYESAMPLFHDYDYLSPLYHQKYCVDYFKWMVDYMKPEENTGGLTRFKNRVEELMNLGYLTQEEVNDWLNWYKNNSIAKPRYPEWHP